MWEYVSYLDTTFYDMWLYCADSLGMGMGIGLIASSLFTKAIFTPFIMYSVRLRRLTLAANGGTQDEAHLARLGRVNGEHETLLATGCKTLTISLFRTVKLLRSSAAR